MKILLISPERERKKEETFLFKLGFLNLPYVAAVTPLIWMRIICLKNANAKVNSAALNAE